MILVNREIRNCFSLIISSNPQEEMEALIAASMIVDRATKLMVQGKISPEDLLEFVEPHISDIDQYIEEVEHNLDEIFLGD